VKLLLATSRNARSGRELFPAIRFRPSLLFYCFAAGFFFCINSSHAESLVLETSTQTATAGFFQLSWSFPHAPDDISYQLFEDSDLESSGAKLIYTGPDMASVISGKADGTYKYYVSASSSGWPDRQVSQTITVTVAHHSLKNALIVLVIGFLIFLSVIFVILRGER